jgi:peptide/nickel transport system ATP-binding protein
MKVSNLFWKSKVRQRARFGTGSGSFTKGQNKQKQWGQEFRNKKILKLKTILGIVQTMPEQPIFSVRNLSTSLEIGKKTFRVVDGLSFDLHRGKTLALVGESGCGKTLTAFSVMRLLPTPPAIPSEGEVIYQGRNLLTISENDMRRYRGGRIAMIFQDPTSALNPVYTIGDQMMETVQLHLNLFGDEAVNRCVQALAEVGISQPRDLLFNYPHQLSGGMRQRVIIAMALICEPDVLIADEPTTALDVTIQAQVLGLIQNLQKRKGMAVLLITHDMGVVAELADDVIVMYASQAVEIGTVNDIFDRMAHPYTMGLFASRPSTEMMKGTLQPIKGNVPPLGLYPDGCRFHPRCPYVMEKCLTGKVPNFCINEGHFAKCWLHDESEEGEIRKSLAIKGQE